MLFFEILVVLFLLFYIMEPGEIQINNYLLTHDIDDNAILSPDEMEDNDNKDYYGDYGKE